MTDFLLANSLKIALFIGIVAGYPLLWWRRDKMAFTRRWQIFLLCVAFTFVSVVSVLLFATMEKELAGEGFTFGAVSVCGVYLICPLFIFVLATLLKRSGGVVFDNYALYAIPSLIIMRLNCLVSGCCLGRFIPGATLRWPTRELEIVFYILLFFFLLRVEKKESAPGRLFPLMMIGYGVFRFFEEGFRVADVAGIWHLTHLWSILCAVIGAGVYIELGNRKKQPKTTKRR